MRGFIRSLAAAIIGIAIVTVAGRAWADKEAARPADAVTAVRQALAFLNAAPPNFEEAAEKATWAMEVKDQTGVDRAALEQGLEALRTGDATRARTRLRQALAPLAGMSAGKRPRDRTGQPVNQGTETAVRSRQGAPLEALTVRFEGGTEDSATLALAVVLALAGGVILRRA